MSAWLRAPRRRWAAAALVLAVGLAHWATIEYWQDLSRLGAGAANVLPPPMQVAFVTTLQVTPPAPAKTAPAPRPSPPVKPLPPRTDAIAAVPVEPPPPDFADPAEPPAAKPPTPNTGGPPNTADDGPPYPQWPPSTRLEYELSGYYRGALHGSARVEWLRETDAYQVRLGIEVPLAFARELVSEGVTTWEGLQPRHFVQQTRITLRGSHAETIDISPEGITLADGRRLPPAPGVQDSASQFVQIAWLFARQPERLQVGQSVEFPLALPRRVAPWVYDITEQTPLSLPFATVETFHLQPRAGLLQPDDLAAEAWFAPSLQHLPVRILIRQNADAYIELNLKDAPLQARWYPLP